MNSKQRVTESIQAGHFGIAFRLQLFIMVISHECFGRSCSIWNHDLTGIIQIGQFGVICGPKLFVMVNSEQKWLMKQIVKLRNRILAEINQAGEFG